MKNPDGQIEHDRHSIAAFYEQLYKLLETDNEEATNPTGSAQQQKQIPPFTWQELDKVLRLLKTRRHMPTRSTTPVVQPNFRSTNVTTSRMANHSIQTTLKAVTHNSRKITEPSPQYHYYTNCVHGYSTTDLNQFSTTTRATNKLDSDANAAPSTIYSPPPSYKRLRTSTEFHCSSQP